MMWLFLKQYLLPVSVAWFSCIIRGQYEPYGENVALGKSTNQSSACNGSGFIYDASLGVVGVKSTQLTNRTCSHTGDQWNYTYWTMDLVGFYFIKFIRIYQWPSEYNVSQLNGSEMYVRLNDDRWQRIYFNSTWLPSVFNLNVTLDKPIGEIMLNNTQEQVEVPYICICQLEAFEVLECLPYSIGNGSINVVKYGESNQNFTYGTTLNVTCHEGYMMSDDGVVANETEITLECNATGNWSKNLTCSVIDCGWPLNVPNNSQQTLTPGIGGNTTYNATLTVDCNEGYNHSLQEIQPLRCDRAGCWEGSLGNCNVIDCGRPLNIPDNSTVISSTGLAGNTSYNATFTVVCNKGFNYTLPGNDTIRCGVNGHWNIILGLCEVIDCGRPLNIPDNSTIMSSTGLAGNTSYNATLTVVCDKGFNYTLPGNDTIRCADEGQWIGFLGLCQVIDCGQPQNIPDNSTIMISTGTAGNTSYMATFTVVCNNGFYYTLPGNETILCGNEGRWTGFLGLCKVIDCGQPLNIHDNSTIMTSPGLAENTSYNATFTVICDNGFDYTLPGNETILCSNEGQWTSILGRSEDDLIECGLRPTPPKNSVPIITAGIAGDTSYNATMTVVCTESYSYTLPGSETVRCGDDGHWEAILGNCDKPSPDMTSVIVGSVVTPVIVVVLVVSIFIFMRRRKKHKYDTTRNLDQIDEIKMGNSSNPAEMDYENGRWDRTKRGQGSHFTQNPSNGSAQATETDGDDDCYENIPSIRTVDIKVEDLFDFVLQRRSKSNLYEEEYKQVARSVTKSKDVAMQAENKNKNRYKGMVPYDENRVKLHVWDLDMETDYINASFIDGFSRPQAYVAAQGPMENTLNDFWRMIWQLKTKKIVMLTNLTEGTGRKCTQYWPDEGAIDFEKINVQLIQTDQFSDFTIRTMKLKMNNGLGDQKSRMIKQFHFTTWPDKSVPRYSSSMVHFRQKIHSTEVEGTSNGPLVVHCSAGVGRTGTFIAIDFLVNQAEAQGNVNVAFCLESLRNQRVLMVQTLEQYIFIHEILVEALTCTTSAISARDFQEEYRKLMIREPKQKKTFLQLAFEKLQILNPNTDENMYALAKETGNRDNNRYCNILPDENYRPYLSTYVNGRNNYINAVFVPAYKDNDAFIITQTPLENTIVDFWRLVYQYDVSSIVMLNTLSQMKDSERYWPQKGSVFNCPPFEIHLESEETFGCCEVFKLILICQEEQRYVRLSRASYWADDERVPKSPVHVLEHVELVQGWQTESAGRNPLVVHCMNGAERSGLFCVIAAVLERTKIEQDVAIEQIVRQLRHRRPQIIPDLEQFRFCHEAVLAYLNQYDTYANF